MIKRRLKLLDNRTDSEPDSTGGEKKNDVV
jgi:hypothetical protein